MGGLAAALHDAGQLDRAIRLHEETLKLRRAKLGEDDPDTLISMNTLALAYQSAGQLERAIDMHEQALKLRRAKLGEDHPSTLISMNNLALSYWKAGRPDRAIPLYEATIKVRLVKLGEDHPYTLTTMNNLALAYLELSQPDRAIPILERTLKAQRANPAKAIPTRSERCTILRRLTTCQVSSTARSLCWPTSSAPAVQTGRGPSGYAHVDEQPRRNVPGLGFARSGHPTS